eukprot:CAMPEP_0171335998 /NCGR_PEP_ID=MMETSP0878-20121228/5711_1 /TAXON_ID=67004 /ORGANISM="Thalassiosira weissflogii, Strain CCMP1336" /LENGTH=338 /DNA_ID=CAMNT_0011837363 /DNA_START=775 /DNA_END=1791 /DNA_ORIENTATION=+
MFVLTLLSDTIRIPPPLLSQPTLTSIQSQIEKRYPNKIIIDVGLVICPYGPPLKIGDGILAPGDGGAHHQVIFQCLVFRPFVEEVLVGTVTESHEEGIVVSVGGFFDHVFIPAHWMLNPSRFDEGLGLWVWTPNYDDDDDDEEEDGGEDDGDGDGDGGENDAEEGQNQQRKQQKQQQPQSEGEEVEQEENRFEIEIGSEIRFKVKSVNFTRITTTMKGVQATTTTTAKVSDRAFALEGTESKGGANGEKENGIRGGNGDSGGGGGIRRRSSSADLSDSPNHPAPMQIVGSICEDGLGLTSWWKSAEEEEDEGEGGEEEEGEGEGFDEYAEGDGDPAEY